MARLTCSPRRHMHHRTQSSSERRWQHCSWLILSCTIGSQMESSPSDHRTGNQDYTLQWLTVRCPTLCTSLHQSQPEQLWWNRWPWLWICEQLVIETWKQLCLRLQDEHIHCRPPGYTDNIQTAIPGSSPVRIQPILRDIWRLCRFYRPSRAGRYGTDSTIDW